MKKKCLIILIFILVFMQTGCGLLFNKDTDQGRAAADGQNSANSDWAGDPVSYTTKIVIVDGPSDLERKMKAVSQLEQLKKELPDSILDLERRAIEDRNTAIKLMESQCYYDGKAEFNIDENSKPVKVTLTLDPGPRFVVGEAKIIYEPEPVIPEAFKNRERVTGFWGLEKVKLPPPSFPAAIPGIDVGKPVIASDMLKAVESVPENLRNTGYPLAKLISSTYTLDKEKRLLNASILINPGPPALMGKVEINGEKEVHQSYLRKLVPWKPGKEPWDANLLENYANQLRGLGLFCSVEVQPDLENFSAKSAKTRDGAVIIPARVTVQEGPYRTLSANARYDTDSGFGVEGIWENRNLFHNGERLKVDVPISQQLYGIKAHFEKPAFLERQQMLFADMSALWENTDAYKQESIKGELGFLRRLARRWWGGLSLFAEGGSIEENENDKKDYGVISPRAGLRYDGRNNRANPTSGGMMDFRLKPFSGYYENYFGGLAGTLSMTGYYAPLGKRNDGTINDEIVLAARAEGGAMPYSSPLAQIPASLRYYTGGAGSVRGYVYQSIGPKDGEGDPKGGRSYQVVNLESRFMVTKDIGIVPFLDGGMVYSTEFPKIIGAMDWGTGLGFRYYTPIGPVRLDVATPLHRINGDPPIQLYISIGQSF